MKGDTNMSGCCNGCLTNIDHQVNSIVCNLQNFNDNGDCPCTKCVVKMICQNACPDYFDFKRDSEYEDRRSVCDNKQ